MFMAPDNKIQEASQVALPYAVLGILGVWHSVLMQHKYVEPLCVWNLLAGSWSDPALFACNHCKTWLRLAFLQ